MAGEFQTTFIPKGSITPSAQTISTKKKVRSIFTLITFLIFILSAVAGGYLFVRTTLVQKNIDSITQELTEVSKTLDDSTIKNITELSDRLQYAQDLLNNHLAPSEIFTILEEYTLPSIGFNSFTYDYQKGDVIKVAGTGVASGFASIVLQSDAYGDSQFLRDVIFSNLQTNPETKTVSFSFEAKLDRSAILFKNVVNTEGSNLPVNTEGN